MRDACRAGTCAATWAAASIITPSDRARGVALQPRLDGLALERQSHSVMPRLGGLNQIAAGGVLPDSFDDA